VGRVEVIVVDTHVLIWWTDAPYKLSRSAREALEKNEVIAVSAITGWEVGILARRRRIEIEGDALSWMRDLAAAQNLRLLPVTLEISAQAAELHELLRDPIDCLIAATALAHNAPLTTKDDRIRTSGVVETIW
jgi:PIN domain nuclease of toxin-antitoxin system